jgi:hypothetical protein
MPDEPTIQNSPSLFVPGSVTLPQPGQGLPLPLGAVSPAQTALSALQPSPADLSMPPDISAISMSPGGVGGLMNPALQAPPVPVEKQGGFASSLLRYLAPGLALGMMHNLMLNAPEQGVAGPITPPTGSVKENMFGRVLGTIGNLVGQAASQAAQTTGMTFEQQAQFAAGGRAQQELQLQQQQLQLQQGRFGLEQQKAPLELELIRQQVVGENIKNQLGLARAAFLQNPQLGEQQLDAVAKSMNLNADEQARYDAAKAAPTSDPFARYKAMDEALGKAASDRALFGRSATVIKQQAGAVLTKAGGSLGDDLATSQAKLDRAVQEGRISQDEHDKAMSFLSVNASPASAKSLAEENNRTKMAVATLMSNPRWAMVNVLRDRFNLQVAEATGQLPTSAQKNRAQFAQQAIDQLPDLRNLLSQAQSRNLLGPIQGRYADFMAGKIGTTGNPADDKLMGNLRSSLNFFESMMVKAHLGGESSDAERARVREDIGQSFQTPAMIAGGLEASEKVLRSYAAAAPYFNVAGTGTTAFPRVGGSPQATGGAATKTQPPASPSQPKATPKATHKFNPATGGIEAISGR